jgi:hypothetical protein
MKFMLTDQLVYYIILIYQEVVFMGFITLKFVAGLIVGGGVGYAYYRFVGCSSGSCPITSNPYSSIIYGMVLGGLITW